MDLRLSPLSNHGGACLKMLRSRLPKFLRISTEVIQSLAIRAF